MKKEVKKTAEEAEITRNFARLLPSMLQKIQDNKRLTKSEMGYQIGHIKPYHPVSLYWDYYKRDEVAEAFNKLFGTSRKIDRRTDYRR